MLQKNQVILIKWESIISAIVKFMHSTLEWGK